MLTKNQPKIKHIIYQWASEWAIMCLDGYKNCKTEWKILDFKNNWMNFSQHKMKENLFYAQSKECGPAVAHQRVTFARFIYFKCP